jgi:hypothetical protein
MSSTTRLIALAALLATFTAAAPPPAPKITAVWPARGSIAGGTYVTVRGVGFTRNGEPGTTRVYIAGKECT